jgi:outer membrane protein
MKYLRHIVIIFAVCILPHTSLAATSLIETYREALEHDTQYKIARHAYTATQEKLPQGRAALLPSIDFFGEARNVNLDTKRVLGEDLIKNRGMVIMATQPLFRVENFIIYQQSKNEVAQGDARFMLAAQDLILRVTQAYFDVLIAKVNVEAKEAQEKAFGKQLELMKHNLEFGLGTIVDLNEAEARHDLAVSQEIAARNTLEIKKHNLQRITNRVPSSFASASIDKIVSAPLAAPFGRMEEWVKLAEEKNFPVKIQQFDYEIAKQETSRARAGHYPTLDLVGQYNNQIDNPFVVSQRGVDFESKAIGIELNFLYFKDLRHNLE